MGSIGVSDKVGTTIMSMNLPKLQSNLLQSLPYEVQEWIRQLQNLVIAAGGTVTSVSVTTAAGVSGSVATPTSTPAITITLGDVTPTSVTTGAISGTTVVASDTITPHQTKGIVGTTTNNNAQAGSIGEFISSSVLIGSAIGIASGGVADITSISLTAGDWEVWGSLGTNPAGGTTTQYAMVWVSATSATIPTFPTNSSFSQLSTQTLAAYGIVLPSGKMRFSLSGTTTIYLSFSLGFLVSTNGGYGIIQARRIR